VEHLLSSATASESPRPLAGLRVVELARILAGPWAGQVLADLGAEVVKVEAPAGDDTRGWGPPFIGDRGAAYFHAANRGKRSVVADFASAEGCETARRLCLDADVVIENFKVGGLVKWGLDYPSLAQENPRLVYCSITGFGQTGPYAGRPGYDVMIQAMSGIMSLTGAPDGEPMKIGVALADIVTGLYAVIAIQAALSRRERTGRGAHLDMALLDCMTGVLANQAMNYLVTGVEPKRLGNAHPNIVPYEAFPCADGYVMIAVGNDRQFRAFASLLGEGPLSDDPRFCDNASRVANRAVLVPLLKRRTAAFGSADLLARLSEAGVPAGPINGLAAAFADPQFVHRGMVVETGGPGERLPGLRTPILIDGRPTAAARPAPRLGEHTLEIEAELERSAMNDTKGGAGPRIAGRHRLHDGFLKLDRLDVAADGAIHPREVVIAQDAVAVLAVDADRQAALLVRQWRPAMHVAGGEAMVLEAAAGKIDPGETPEEAARREAYEELGVELRELRPAGLLLPSPGILTERIHLFLADFAAADRTGRGGGLDEEAEGIEVVEMPLGRLFGMAMDGGLGDAKTLALAFRLMVEKSTARAAG